MSTWQIPPHTFDALYRYYRHRIPTGGFLAAVIKNDGLEAARRADDKNRPALADILLFNNSAHAYQQDCINAGDFSGCDLKWETWRLRYSPEATDIRFDLGDDNE
tara:strand:+ start:151 stop:465 length:315 start_codon:yes stop_codon:yes gene_type:complete